MLRLRWKLYDGAWGSKPVGHAPGFVRPANLDPACGEGSCSITRLILTGERPLPGDTVWEDLGKVGAVENCLIEGLLGSSCNTNNVRHCVLVTLVYVMSTVWPQGRWISVILQHVPLQSCSKGDNQR